jgi:surface antigen/LysM repeat protein
MPELTLPAFAPRISRQGLRRHNRLIIIGGNVLLLLAVAIFVLANRTASTTVRTSTASTVVSTTSSVSSPLDQVSSAQIALQAAQMTNLPELTMVKNRADSEAALLAVVPSDTHILAKPQLVSTGQKSRHDIISYKVKQGDSVATLAAKYNVSANSIRWSNNLSSDTLTNGATVLIPPAEGIVYKVKDGDTIAGIVGKFQANQNTFVTVNDAENGRLSAGELVWIPNGIQPLPVVRAAATGLSLGAPGGAFRFTGSAENNGYAYGWCTYWAAKRRAQVGNPIPPNWGDAISWAAAARAQGHPVTQVPQGGTIIWFPGMNHVGFVEAVNADGSAYISEMNAVGWNVVSYRTIPAAQVANYRYIY